MKPEPVQLPSRTELVGRLRAHERSNIYRMRVTLTLLAVWLLAPVLVIVILRWGNRPFAAPVEILWFLALFGISFASPRWNRWYMRKVMLVCPSCGTPYLGPAAQVAVASGRCGRCGERVLNDA